MQRFKRKLERVALEEEIACLQLQLYREEYAFLGPRDRYHRRPPDPQRSAPRDPTDPLNPHCAQLDPRGRTPDVFDLILHHQNAPRRPYTARGNEIRSTVHRGQRKLLFSEIGALLKTDPNKAYTAVYAGAAPGIHTPFLSRLFPNITFHLYDPRPFAIRETARIKLHEEYFTDEIAHKYREEYEGVIFICDIRRTTDEKNVWEDMCAQQKWYNIMRPCITSLKFRLPWPGAAVLQGGSDNVEYLQGEIHLPIWGPQSTTESRLVIVGPDASNMSYDCKAYEEEMSHFNHMVRPSIHEHPEIRGLDGCFDCTAEVALLAQYCLRAGATAVDYDEVARLSADITTVLGRGV
jgi:cap2 methyltransferase